MKILQITAAVALAMGFASQASAAIVTINFDSLANGAVVTNQYAEATFSSQAGSEVLITAQNLGSSTPNFICSGQNGSINCSDDVYVDFTSSVSGLSFLSIGANDVGKNGEVRVFAGATLLGTVDIIGDGTALSPDLVNLGAYSGITRIEIANVTDTAGLGFDDFTFSTGPAVPEPASWAMMIAGFGLIGAAARRRKAIAA